MEGTSAIQTTMTVAEFSPLLPPPHCVFLFCPAKFQGLDLLELLSLKSLIKSDRLHGSEILWETVPKLWLVFYEIIFSTLTLCFQEMFVHLYQAFSSNLFVDWLQYLWKKSCYCRNQVPHSSNSFCKFQTWMKPICYIIFCLRFLGYNSFFKSENWLGCCHFFL